MCLKEVTMEKLVKYLFDFSLMFYLASWVVFSQQGGTLAIVMVHLSTRMILITSLFLPLINRLRMPLPTHSIWYLGFIILAVIVSVKLNGINTVYNVITIMLRIVYLSFFVAIRLQKEPLVGEYIAKLSWIGILEIFLLIACIPTQEWLNALRYGYRLGVGSIQVNMCALALAYSALFSFFGIWMGHKKYIIIGGAELAVILLFQSRTSYLILIAGIILFLSSYYKFSQKSVKRFMQYGMLGLCLGGYIVFFSEIGVKFMNRIFSYDDSIMYRMLIIKTSIQLWWEKPFVGYGFGAMQVLMEEKLGRGWAAHNNMIGLIMSVGLIGLFYYYIYILYWGIVLLSRTRKNKEMSMVFTILAVTVLADIAGENYYAILVQTFLAIVVGTAQTKGIKRRIA